MPDDSLDPPPPTIVPDKPPKPQPQPWRAQRWLLIVVAVIVVLLLLYVGYGRMADRSAEGTPGTRPPDTQTPPGTTP